MSDAVTPESLNALAAQLESNAEAHRESQGTERRRAAAELRAAADQLAGVQQGFNVLNQNYRRVEANLEAEIRQHHEEWRINARLLAEAEAKLAAVETENRVLRDAPKAARVDALLDAAEVLAAWYKNGDVDPVGALRYMATRDSFTRWSPRIDKSEAKRDSPCLNRQSSPEPKPRSTRGQQNRPQEIHR